jgi:uncharacterized RmlC-like cupin family protein
LSSFDKIHELPFFFNLSETLRKDKAKITTLACQTLFVPGGAPHLVVNLSDTVAFAGNFLDESNFEAAMLIVIYMFDIVARV